MQNAAKSPAKGRQPLVDEAFLLHFDVTLGARHSLCVALFSKLVNKMNNAPLAKAREARFVDEGRALLIFSLIY